MGHPIVYGHWILFSDYVTKLFSLKGHPDGRCTDAKWDPCILFLALGAQRLKTCLLAFSYLGTLLIQKGEKNILNCTIPLSREPWQNSRKSCGHGLLDCRPGLIDCEPGLLMLRTLITKVVDPDYNFSEPEQLATLLLYESKRSYQCTLSYILAINGFPLIKWNFIFITH